MCGKKLTFMVFTLVKSALNLSIFTHGAFPHSNLQVEFFENLFLPTQKGVEKTMICFTKIQWENMKMTWRYM